MTPLIKICGLTRIEDALAAAEAGADFLGFVFVASPRRVTPEQAAAIAAAVSRLENPPKIVGVFRDERPETVREIARHVGLDLVQLHGDESDEDVRAVGVEVIRSVPVGMAPPAKDVAPGAAWLLFDTADPRGGGTGRSFDWSLLANVDRARPFFLAGGIHPENVGQAIRIARPDAIDVSSGVESAPGIKDHERIRRLMENARR